MMAPVHVRVCLDCEEEYRAEVARCADCGGELQDRYDDEPLEASSTFATPATASDEPRAEAHALATSADARELVPLADRLLEAGVEFRVVAREVRGEERPRGYELRVTDVDRSAALRAVAGLTGPHSGVTLLETWAAAGDDEPTELLCPACETPVRTSATECSECGLGLEEEREG